MFTPVTHITEVQLCCCCFVLIYVACCTQGAFRKRLVAEAAGLKQDAQAFRIEWDAHGPMIAGLSPIDAEHRLKKLQPVFEVCAHTTHQGETVGMLHNASLRPLNHLPIGIFYLNVKLSESALLGYGRVRA